MRGAHRFWAPSSAATALATHWKADPSLARRLRLGSPVKTTAIYRSFAPVLLSSVALLFGASCGSSIAVNSTVDEVDAHPGDGICLTASNVCSLRAAIQEANAYSIQNNVVVT